MPVQNKIHKNPVKHHKYLFAASLGYYGLLFLLSLAATFLSVFPQNIMKTGIINLSDSDNTLFIIIFSFADLLFILCLLGVLLMKKHLKTALYIFVSANISLCLAAFFMVFSINNLVFITMNVIFIVLYIKRFKKIQINGK